MLAYSDPTARWVPFVLVLIIAGAVWGGLVWQNFEFAQANQFTLVVLVVLLVGLFLQGWVYWKGQVDRLSLEGSNAEVVTTRWVGPGRRIRFTPFEASGWRATPKSTDKTMPGSILVTVRGEELSLSMLNPQVVDLNALSRLNPEFFRKLRNDYPGFASRSAA